MLKPYSSQVLCFRRKMLFYDTYDLNLNFVSYFVQNIVKVS
jgi:hypothetical protein